MTLTYSEQEARAYAAGDTEHAAILAGAADYEAVQATVSELEEAASCYPGEDCLGELADKIASALKKAGAPEFIGREIYALVMQTQEELWEEARQGAEHISKFIEEIES